MFRLANCEPLCSSLRPATERSTLCSRVTEARRTVQCSNLRRLEQLCDAQDGLRRQHARALLLVPEDHCLADATVVVVVERDLAVVVVDRSTSARLHEHQCGARDLEVTPVRLDECVRRKVRHQVGVELVDLE